MLSIGWVVGPVVGGYAAQLAGFGAPFFITAALAFTCYPALCVLMPRGNPWLPPLAALPPVEKCWRLTHACCLALRMHAEHYDVEKSA